MRIFAAKVTGGVIVPESAEELVEGTTVSVVTHDQTPFTASPEEEEELVAALADLGETVPAEEVLARLR